MDIKEFVDEVKVFLKAGDGGNGCVSFRREKYVPFGGPDGGNGGSGGNIYFVASKDINTLTHLALKPHLRAENGEHGKGNNKYGRKAEDLIIYVPCGTVIKNLDGEILADLVNDGDRFLAARGGKGGRGNATFKSSINQAPDYAEKGEKGEERVYKLELSLIADVGLVGFPNAGKSSFLSRVTKASPKIADYPFTTLNPNIGVCLYKNNSFVIADIPGLIEGANKGKGLGDKFLKHILRTRILLHIIDPMGYYDIDPLKGIGILKKELEGYSKKLVKKERILVVNKADLPVAEEVYRKIKNKYKKHKVFLISAVTGYGVEKLLDYLINKIAEIKKRESEQTVDKKSEVKVIKVEKGYEITKVSEDKYIVRGQSVERLVGITDLDNKNAVRRLFNIFKKIGLIKSLKKHGIKENDTVIIGDAEFIWKTYYSDNP